MFGIAMSEKEPIEKQDSGLEVAKQMAEAEEGIGRKLKGPSQYVVPTIAVAWSLFQLSIASWWILDTIFIRAVHLGFALSIVFLNYPFFKKKRFGLEFLSAKDRIPVFDYIIAIVAAFSAIYIVIDYQGITTRYGLPAPSS